MHRMRSCERQERVIVAHPIRPKLMRCAQLERQGSPWRGARAVFLPILVAVGWKIDAQGVCATSHVGAVEVHAPQVEAKVRFGVDQESVFAPRIVALPPMTVARRC
eukprot:4118879-Prymnesium_polylepis.1